MEAEPTSSGICEIEGHSFYGELLNRNSIIVDVGGNQGNFAAEMMKRFDCYLEVYEPDLLAFTTTSLRLNSDRAIVQMRAVAGKSGIRSFYRAAPLSGGNSIIEGHSEFESYGEKATVHQVYAVSMESILRRLPSVDLVKLDCEGAEIEIIEQTPPQLWSKVRQITIEFHEFCFETVSAAQIESAIGRLESYGFRRITASPLDSLFVRR